MAQSKKGCEKWG